MPIYDNLSEINPDALTADGLEKAYIGYTVNHHHPVVAVYDLDVCVAVLVEEGMSEDEAIEYLEFNTLGAYVGENGPIFIKTE